MESELLTFLPLQIPHGLAVSKSDAFISVLASAKGSSRLILLVMLSSNKNINEIFQRFGEALLPFQLSK